MSWWIIPIALSLASNVIWKNVLGKENLKKCQRERYKISEINNIGNDLIAYFLTYSVSLPSVLFLPPEKGLAVLLIIMVLIFFLFKVNKIMLFTPFLSTLGYYELEVKTEEGASFYLISDRKPVKNEVLDLLRLNGYIYFMQTNYDSGRIDQLIVA